MRQVNVFTNGDYPVQLEQRADGSFRITYGAEVHDRLSYTDAAREYGECVFHSLACAGKFDNPIGE